MTKYRIKLNGKVYEMEVELVGESGMAQPANTAATAAVSTPVRETPNPPRMAATPSVATRKAGAVTSPLQGTIIKINVANGDAVKAGQTVLVLEAMKMQNDIAAPKDGTLSGLSVAAGENVKSGQVLFVVE